ncbi:SLC13 family permease [Stenotrophomonas sp. C3(2023)]|uniref:SLC13 family permease n=1 Tax=Stenotrophomonas sp. C3(2023) TaxID=3080277 RepID=UPI00293C60DC|nr:SLC13 family permease [Stenotrophomonas sp. C3(2023)]MDV3467584.1 SLC13 family permease [Stenotrophomonas sp. C3(2023)]
MTAGIALLLLLATTTLLASGRVLPMVVFALLPPLAALLLGTSPQQLGVAVQAGLARTAPVATLFLCAVCFAGLMRERGVFQPLMTLALRASGTQPVRVCLVTALLGLLAHLDGAGPTTFLLVLPVLLPVYDALQMRRSTLLMLLAAAAGLFNLLPWGGPLGRAAAVTGIDVTTLWRTLLPVQLLGIALLLAMAALAGVVESRRRGSHVQPVQPVQPSVIAEPPCVPPRRSARAEVILCLLTLALLLGTTVPAWLVFMLALAVALPLGASSLHEQRRHLARHAPAAVELALVVLSAGVLLGVLEGTGMIKALADAASSALPTALLRHQHLLLAVLATPAHLLVSTDAWYFALLPLVLQSSAAHGVEASSVVNALTLANTLGGYVGPYSTAVWLALGMSGVSYSDYLRRVLPWIWSYTLLMLGIGYLLGLF